MGRRDTSLQAELLEIEDLLSDEDIDDELEQALKIERARILQAIKTPIDDQSMI